MSLFATIIFAIVARAETDSMLLPEDLAPPKNPPMLEFSGEEPSLPLEMTYLACDYCQRILEYKNIESQASPFRPTEAK